MPAAPLVPALADVPPELVPPCAELDPPVPPAPPLIGVSYGSSFDGAAHPIMSAQHTPDDVCKNLERSS